jgi:hypothetical protein
MVKFRQKTIHCGKGCRTRFRDIDIIPGFEQGNGRRKRKSKKSKPSQERLNEKNAVKYLHRLIKTNFDSSDLHVTLTYTDENLPENEEEANKMVENFLKKVRYARRKLGLPPLKYIRANENFDGQGRPHHHIIMSGGMSRDEIEGMWSVGKGKNAVKIGLTTADLLQFDNAGIEGLVKYIIKQTLKDIEKESGSLEGQLNLSEIECVITAEELLGDGRAKGRKRWTQSRNLILPHESVREKAISNKEYQRLSTLPQDCNDIRDFWEKRNPGYALDTFKREYNGLTGMYSFYATMHRKDWKEARRD